MRSIPLTKGYTAQVDDADYEQVLAIGPWFAHEHRHKDGSIKVVYAHRSVRKANNVRTLQLLHRFLLNVTNPRVQVDHEDHNGLNCQRYNIRKANAQQNQGNQEKRAGTSSVYRGVTERYRGKPWAASIRDKGKQTQLGTFDSEVEAAIAYDKAAILIHGEFANLNFTKENYATTKR